MNPSRLLTTKLTVTDRQLRLLIFNPHTPILSIVIVILIALGFVARQRISRNPPKSVIPVVKSSLPWVGSALDFVRAPVKFLQNCRALYGPIYKIHVAGRTILVTSSPKAITNMLQSKKMDFDIPDYLNLHHISGLDESRMPTIWPTVLRVFSMSHKFFAPHRFGPIMESYNTTLVQHFRMFTAPNDPTTLCLDDFVFRTCHFAVYGMLMGKNFKARTYNDWRIYDSGVHDIIRRLPFFSRGPTNARERLLETVSDHIQQHWIGVGKEGCLYGASEVISAVTRTLKESASTDEETSRIVSYLLWGTASNIGRLTNWVMRYILVNPDVYKSIKKEIHQAVGTKYSQLNDILVMDAQSLGTDFPLLTSTVDEVIRLMSQSVILRQASMDTHLVGDDEFDISISKGDYVLADTQGYHLSQDHFEDPQSFKADRYVLKSKKGTGQGTSPSLAFSTGPRVCAGAHLAKANVTMFVVLCFHLYDVEINFKNGVESALEVVHNSFLQLPLPKYKANISLHRRHIQ